MDDDNLLDALLGIPPKLFFTVELDIKTTIRGIVGRRRYGGYCPPQAIIPVFAIPERETREKVHIELNTARIEQRAKDKRETRIKKQLKQKQ